MLSLSQSLHSEVGVQSAGPEYIIDKGSQQNAIRFHKRPVATCMVVGLFLQYLHAWASELVCTDWQSEGVEGVQVVQGHWVQQQLTQQHLLRHSGAQPMEDVLHTLLWEHSPYHTANTTVNNCLVKKIEEHLF